MNRVRGVSMFRGGVVDEDKITCQSCQPFFGSPLSLLIKDVNVSFVSYKNREQNQQKKTLDLLKAKGFNFTAEREGFFTAFTPAVSH